MSRLVDLYSDDGRVVVGRSNVPFPVSVNVGYAIVAPIITGYTPITTQIQTGWVNTINGAFRTNLSPGKQKKPWWQPTYKTVVTGYAPIYSPVFVGAIPFGIY